MNDCLFCRIVAKEVPSDTVVETDRSVAFNDINPQAPVHVLVVPRRHIDNAAALEHAHADDLADLFVTARQVAARFGVDGPERGFRLVFNVGPEALNSVAHLHLHVIGGRQMGWPPG